MSRIRSGFTLFELLLVLLLIAILYGLFAQNFSINRGEQEGVKLEKLNLYLRERFGFDGQKVTLKCLNECVECKVLVDNDDANTTLDIFDGSSVNAYKYDGRRAEKIEFDDWHISEYRQEKVCFEMSVYPNGSNDKIAVEYKEKVYLFENYLDENRVFGSIGEFQNFAENYQRAPLGI